VIDEQPQATTSRNDDKAELLVTTGTKDFLVLPAASSENMMERRAVERTLGGGSFMNVIEASTTWRERKSPEKSVWKRVGKNSAILDVEKLERSLTLPTMLDLIKKEISVR
jgi:hypothetical protein